MKGMLRHQSLFHDRCVLFCTIRFFCLHNNFCFILLYCTKAEFMQYIKTGFLSTELEITYSGYVVL